MDETATRALIETEARSKSNMHRLDVVEKKLEDYGAMETSMQLMSQKLDTIETRQDEMRNDIKSIMEKPQRRWESIIQTVLTTAVGALVLYMLAKMGMA